MATGDVKEKKTLTQSLSNFLMKNRKILIGFIVVLFVMAIAVGVYTSIQTSVRGKSYVVIDTATYELADAQKTLSGDELVTRETEIIAPVIELAEKNKNNEIGNRSYMFLAEIHYAKKDWTVAAETWIKAAVAGRKSYTVPICYYNAAVAFEEAGNNAEATINYEKTLEYKDFPLMTHAIFSLGRIADSNNDYEKASEWYNKLKNEYSGDSWASLATSRLIALESEGKIQ